MMHDLKTWPIFFEAICSGKKTFEVRKNDRNFQEGDILHLKEFDPEKQAYSGTSKLKKVTYVMRGGNFGIDPEYCVLGLGRPE